MEWLTTTELIVSRLHRLGTEIAKFLNDYFAVTPANKPEDTLVVISPAGNHFFREVTASGKSIQHAIFEDFRRLSHLVKAIAEKFTEKDRNLIKDSLAGIENLITLEGLTWYKTKTEARAALEKHAESISSTLHAIFPSDQSECLLVADTNALYASPDFQKWKFPGLSKFKICLTPAVVKELDEHKMHHRNEAVRNKARIIINRIKELRKRGALTDGVEVIKGSIGLVAIAAEPDFSSTIPWLDPNNSDDRTVATTLELMRSNAGRPIVVVTGDLNLQNKCELAGIPFIDLSQPSLGSLCMTTHLWSLVLK